MDKTSALNAWEYLATVKPGEGRLDSFLALNLTLPPPDKFAGLPLWSVFIRSLAKLAPAEQADHARLQQILEERILPQASYQQPDKAGATLPMLVILSNDKLKFSPEKILSFIRKADLETHGAAAIGFLDLLVENREKVNFSPSQIMDVLFQANLSSLPIRQVVDLLQKIGMKNHGPDGWSLPMLLARSNKKLKLSPEQLMSLFASADPLKANKDGVTLAMLVAQHNYALQLSPDQLLKIFRQSDVKQQVASQGSPSGQTLAMLVARHNHRLKLSPLQLMEVFYRASPQQRDGDGRSLSMFITVHNDQLHVPPKQLLEIFNKDDMRKQAKDGYTLPMLVALHNEKLLLPQEALMHIFRKADLKIQSSYGHTVPMLVAINNDKLFLNADQLMEIFQKADWEQQNKDGKNLPLLIAENHDKLGLAQGQVDKVMDIINLGGLGVNNVRNTLEVPLEQLMQGNSGLNQAKDAASKLLSEILHQANLSPKAVTEPSPATPPPKA